MITITNVSHRIDQTVILRDINLTLPQQGITALIGPNGAGKSTLLSLVARLNTLQHGQISIDGLDITHTSSQSIAQKLAILTQNNTIHSRITVSDLLMFGRYPHHQGHISQSDYDVVNQVLNRFDLCSLAPRYLSSLSGGQRQRAMIAMVFCQQTPYVLLDEPLNNLDMFHARELMRLLRRLTEEQGLTTVMVVHDINMAAAWADHIIAMKDGQVWMQGSPTEIITRNAIRHIFGLDADVLDYHGKQLVVHHI